MALTWFRNNSTHVLKIVVGYLVIILLCACSGTIPHPEETSGDGKQAAYLLKQLRSFNDDLETLKGIGHFRLKSDGAYRSARIAWAGTRFGAIRLEIMGLTGQPEYTVAADGQNVSFIAYHPYRYHKQKAESIDLEELLSISISSGDIADILAGRIPAADYVTVLLEKNHLTGEELLILKSWWDKTSQKIYMNRDRTLFRAFEAYEFSGELRYRVVYEKTETIEGFELPLKLVIENRRGDRLEITVDRCFPNAVLSPGLFSPDPA